MTEYEWIYLFVAAFYVAMSPFRMPKGDRLIFTVFMAAMYAAAFLVYRGVTTLW